MSKEHILSKTVNKAMGSSIILRTTTGKSISSDSVAAKILCRHHNSALTSIDEEAGKLLKALYDYRMLPTVSSVMPKLVDGAPPFIDVVIDGTKLERWGLKTFLNFSFHNGCIVKDARQCDLTGDHILGYVFGNASRPDFSGIRFFQGVPVPRAKFQENLFFVEQHNVTRKDHLGRVVENLPHYFTLKAFGSRLSAFGNLTARGNFEWMRIVSTQMDHPIKEAPNYPSVITYRQASEDLGSEHFTQLRVRFNW